MFLPQLDQSGDPKAAIAAGLEGSWLNGRCSVWVFLIEEWKCMKERRENERMDGTNMKEKTREPIRKQQR